MAAHERSIERAKWSAQATLATLGREIRTARQAHDLSQFAVARSVSISASKWGRIERGEASSASLDDLAQALAIVGLDLHVRTYPGGQALRDSAHLQLLRRLHERLGAAVGWRTEVPLRNPGDRRAWDALIVVQTVRVGVEAETRARDSQALQRRLALKRRDGSVDHVILLLADTRNNRSFARSCGAGFLAEYPLAGRAILRKLELAQDPGGSGIVFV